MIDPQDRNKVAFFTDTSSMKLIEVVSNSVTSPGAAAFSGPFTNTTTIPHGLGTSDILWLCVGTVPGYSPYFQNVSTPFAIGISGRTSFRVEVDATNLYVIGESASYGSGEEPTATFTFKLFIVLP